jgi:hypothetical protein
MMNTPVTLPMIIVSDRSRGSETQADDSSYVIAAIGILIPAAFALFMWRLTRRTTMSSDRKDLQASLIDD